MPVDLKLARKYPDIPYSVLERMLINARLKGLQDFDVYAFVDPIALKVNVAYRLLKAILENIDCVKCEKNGCDNLQCPVRKTVKGIVTTEIGKMVEEMLEEL